MATIAGAFSAVATFAGTVPGMTHSYGLADLPDKLSRDQLPCAIVIPESLEAASVAFQGNAYSEVFTLRQLVLYQASENIPYKKVLPNLIAFWDTYMTALKAVPFLVAIPPGVAPPIHVPAVPKVVFGVWDWGGEEMKYHGFEITFMNLKINL